MGAPSFSGRESRKAPTRHTGHLPLVLGLVVVGHTAANPDEIPLPLGLAYDTLHFTQAHPPDARQHGPLVGEGKKGSEKGVSS